jgi:hypothetical protein
MAPATVSFKRVRDSEAGSEDAVEISVELLEVVVFDDVVVKNFAVCLLLLLSR